MKINILPLTCLSISALIGLASCGGGGDDAAPPAPPAAIQGAATRDVQAIFNANCALADCHGTPLGGPMSLEPANSYGNTVNQPAQASVGTRLIPGDAINSVLFRRISGITAGAQMPLNAAPLAPAQQDLIRNWINGGALHDLNVSLSGMSPHLNQLMEFRVVSTAGALRTKMLVDPLVGPTLSFFQPMVVPPGAFTLDFFADLNGNRLYDAPPTDHTWRVSVPDDRNVSFTHNTTFTDIGAAAASEPGGLFTLNTTGVAAIHAGQLLELRVIKTANGQTVGSYRLAVIPAGDFPIAIPGILENGQEYQVDFYADNNGNGVYDAPPNDHAWRLTGIAGPTGLTLNFVHNGTFTDIRY